MQYPIGVLHISGQHVYQRQSNLFRYKSTYRGVLALDAGAVKAQGSDTCGTAGDMEDALIITLSGLWLRQVFGCQGDGFHHTHRNIYLGGGKDLWAIL